MLSLGVGARTPRPPLGAAVLAAFETMLANPEGQPALPRDDALSLSRRLVHSAWPEVGAGTLTVTDEEHHHASGLWRVGLCSPARTRFEVDLGILGGDPSTAHLPYPGRRGRRLRRRLSRRRPVRVGGARHRQGCGKSRALA